MTTHTEISYRALHFFDKNVSNKGVDYKQIINNNLPYFQAGSPFPDWGYAGCGYYGAGEATHWAPFVHAYTSFIAKKYRDNEERRNQMIAFLFGIESHGISDVIWHWGNSALNADDQGFLHSMGHMTSDCDDNWNNCHDRGDRGGDVYLAFRGDSKWLKETWRVPIKDLNEIYDSMSVDSNRASMTECAIMMYLGVRFEPIAAYFLLLQDERNAAFLTEELDLWFHGGLDDMAANVAWQWENLIKLLEDDTEEGRKYHNKFHGIKPNIRSVKKREMFSTLITKDNYRVFREILGVEHNHDETSGDLVLTFKKYDKQNAILKIGDMLTQFNIISPDWKKQTFFDIGNFSNGKKFLKENSNFVDKLSSNLPYSYFGKSVTYGDFDGDGINEVVIGSPGFGKARGAIYLVKLDSDFNLNYSDPFIVGYSEYSRFGFSLTTVDLNHDGVDDLVVSSPTYGKNGPSDSIENFYPKEYQGRVYVYYGKKGVGIVKNSKPDVEISPSNERQEIFFNLGYFLNSGDCNNDGYKDLLIGSPYSQNGGDKRGQAAVFLSILNKEKLTTDEADLKANGMKDYEEFGYSLACRENTLYVGAPGARNLDIGPNQASGAVYALDIVSKSYKYSIFSDKSAARFGASIDISSDILVVGAPSYDVVNKKNNIHNGAVFTYDLKKLSTGEIPMNDYKAMIKSKDNRARFGKQVRIIDNKLLVSAPQYTKNIKLVENGRVYVFDNFQNLPGENFCENADMIFEGVSNSGRFGENISYNNYDNNSIIISAPYTTRTDLSGEIIIASLN